MTDQRTPRRRSFPPYDESSPLSRRDQTLARLDKLLSEQYITPPPEELISDEEIPEDLVDLEEVVEEAKLPPRPRPDRPRALEPRPPAVAPARPAEVEKKSRLSVASAVLQGLILIFVLAWVFLLGVLVGRGHLWQTGFGHDVVVWVEQKVGWTGGQSTPEIVLKKENQADVVIPPTVVSESQPKAEDTQAAPPEEQSPAADDPSAITSDPPTEFDPPQDEMPVWDWPGWTPGGPEGGDAASPPAGDATSATPDVSATPDQSAAADAGDTAWPTAIEPGEDYSPPAEQENGDYDAMLQPSEAPDAPLAEATPLPPELAGIPGTGKFAVQVAMAADEAEAKQKVGQLAGQGFSAYFYQNASGQYLVRVGHFATRQDADAAKVRLDQLGYTKTYVSSLGN